MRVFKIRWFVRFARSERIDDESLSEAIRRAARGLIDADLGGGLIKQRVARRGRGRSGGYRMIVAYRVKERAVFLYGFAKNERENVEPDELEDLRLVARGWLEATSERIETALKDGAIQEVRHDEESDA
ncbi:type II toxin-antitoxin system RelE/ParE family toxin [Methylocystis hirsuta]|uniref:Type II toxin-antitoxin system RelE/ParE family toxin n=1 Tax=Methylocystis hirsuta TaxID=369798 RepID=A0A3M9XM22_9HYPH|nr:type II toxin-antitoxin system RelE/ParE family toxin [Methylocystis hirsuta]RNJ48752.1 type II toxin-antitoxin system RelE/ParE family toxin [Methylocystis hirsuta]